jgi:uncharacterized protein (TIGR02246 family)
MPATFTSTATSEAIDSLRAAHVAAVNAGDVAGWVAMFADDGVQMPPGAPANAGRDMIRLWVDGFLAAVQVEFALHVEEVHSDGDWAFERGTYTIVLRPKAGGGLIHDQGKYITIYQQQRDGTWRLARDIWNSDQPALGAP